MDNVASQTLFDAIAAGDRDAVRQHLDRSPELIAVPNADGLSPLMVALYHGRRELAEDLLARQTPEQLTIHEAAAAGVLARVRQVLDADPQSVNAWSPDGFQPLGLAAFFGHAEAVDLLLQRGGEVNTHARHRFGVAALHAALAGPNPEIARVLIAVGADVNAAQNSGSTPLHETAFNGNLALTQLLLEHGANPAAVNKEGRSAVDVARERGHTQLAELLSGLSARA
jgi:ankyrin repeat protein